MLYRVDEHPVLLLCGTVPAYRDLHAGDKGRDVWQLNRNLRRLGYHAGTGAEFTWKTERALRRLQHRKGLRRRESSVPVTRSSCPRRCGSPR